MIGERFGPRIEIREHQTAVGLDTRDLDQSPVLPLELVVVRSVQLRHAAQPARTVVTPAVIRAYEQLLVAVVTAADAHAAVAA